MHKPRYLATLAAGLGLAVTCVPAAAQTASLCTSAGTTLGFFNGVDTTREQAETALLLLKARYGVVDGTGKTLKYELFYNWTNGFEDFVEVFQQRLQEQGADAASRYELFFTALRGGGSWTDALGTVISTFAGFITSLNDLVRTRQVAALTSLAGTPPTFSNYVEQRARLETTILQGDKLLLFAHSQGNLFANAAYSYALTKTTAASVKVVHVAPASILTNGPHTLADLDLVINALRLTGSVPSITKMIPGYLLRPAGLNGQKDALGHGLLEIYLNPDLPTSGEIDTNVRAALSALVAPPATATNGFFTITLTWNGTGDVDLHTFEPNNSHVYYSAKTGTSGFLDVDNVNANGPEHYYATCDATKLQTGTYRIGINNYRGAAGRTAVVQLSSFNDGPLLTRSLDVGAVRGSGGDATPISVMNVVVTKDASGRFKVTGS